jgi:hypothetical protein
MRDEFQTLALAKLVLKPRLDQTNLRLKASTAGDVQEWDSIPESSLGSSRLRKELSTGLSPNLRGVLGLRAIPHSRTLRQSSCNN